MTLFAGVVVVVSLAVLVWCAIEWVRNDQVYRERMAMLAVASEQAKRDIHAGRADWDRWFDILHEAASYDEMVTHFWRPLRSYWPPELAAALRVSA